MRFPRALSIILASVALAACGGADESFPFGEEASVATDASELVGADVQPFKAPSTWLSSAFTGTRGTFLADVSGGGSADAIAVNDTNILVRLSNGSSSFGSSQTWSTTAFFGSVGTFFADVTGDQKADAIAINSGNILVRPASGSSFGPSQTWSSTAFSGNAGTYVADVTGDGKADVIAVNTNGILVRPSTGTTFGTSQTWSISGFSGTLSTQFTDVDGDKKADAVNINADGVRVRRSTGSAFSTTNEAWSSLGYFGSKATLVADVTGDGTADLVAVDANAIRMRRGSRWFFNATEEIMSTATTPAGAIRVGDITADGRSDVVEFSTSSVSAQVRQDRSIPVRFVQFVNTCSEAVTDQQLTNILNTANKVYREVGLRFYAQTIVLNPDCSGFSTSRVVISPVLADITSPNPTTATELAKAIPYNSSCSLGFSDFASRSESEQLSWAAARCALSGELLVNIVQSTGGGSYGQFPWEGKLVVMPRGNVVGANEITGLPAHEFGHYLGMPHIYGDYGLNYDPAGTTDPVTGQALPLSAYWDLVSTGSGASTLAFDSRLAASTFESSLRAIDNLLTPNIHWFCPSGNAGNPCPATFDIGTIGVHVGDLSGPIWYSGDKRLKGVALRLPEDGKHAVNIMSYNYDPDNADIYPGGLKARTPQFSLSQIEQLQQTLKTDLATPYVTSTGKVIFGDRPRLGITGTAPSVSYVNTGKSAKSGAGTLASNGAETWMVSNEAFDSNGNKVYRWNMVTRAWDGFAMGAQQVAVPCDGARTWPDVTPWAVTTSGAVKRYNGSTFVEPPNSAGSCALSLAVGPRLSGNRMYAWAVGCHPGSGNFEIYRYRQLDGVGGWVPTSGYAIQVAVDRDGVPWARTVEGGIYKANLDSSDMPMATWTQYPTPAGVTAVSLSAGGFRQTLQPVDVLGSDGHLYGSQLSSVSLSDVATPPIAFNRTAAALPYLWALDSAGAAYYAR